MAKKDILLAEWRSDGSSEAQIARSLEYNFGEGGYERNVERMMAQNEMAIRRAQTAERSIDNFTNLLGGVFGQQVSITTDGDGRLTLGSFDMFSGGGLKMLSYSDGVLSTFNSDGSLIRNVSGKEFRNI